MRDDHVSLKHRTARGSSRACAALALLALAPGAAASQTVAKSPRPITRALASSVDSLTSLESIRVLSDGRVLASDPAGRRLVVFGSSLRAIHGVADTLPGAKADALFGGGILLPMAADSSLYLDLLSKAAVVIGPSGQIQRTIAVPEPADLNWMIALGAASDRHGNLVYEKPELFTPPPVPAHLPALIERSDSSPLLRASLTSRRLDTVAWLRSSPSHMLAILGASGDLEYPTIDSPFLGSDTWTVLSDGAIVIVRFADYHLEIIHPDGTRTSTPRVAHEWTRLTDSAKLALITREMVADSVSSALAHRPIPLRIGVDSAFLRSATAPVGVVAATRDDAARGSPSAKGPPIDYYTSPDDLPDYAPPFTSARAVADADDDIWIRVNALSTTNAGIYDVVSRDGTLRDRVAIPGGTNLVGFGPGVVYLTSRTGHSIRLGRFAIK